MAFAITKVQAYGIESEEPLNKRYRQYMYLTVTATAADVALDLGSNQTGSLGTFWTATSGTTVGAGALQAIQDIVTRAEVPESPSLSVLTYVQGTAVGASTYTVALANKTPSIAFNAANGPTSYTVCLKWVLAQQSEPVSYFAST
jgi:hypothetical protein